MLLYCLELPRVPELGAKTTGSKLMASVAEAENEADPATTVPKVLGPSPQAQPGNLYARPEPGANRVHLTRSATTESLGPAAKSERSIRRSTGLSSSSAAQLRERYHNYEEVEISPLARSPTKKHQPARTGSENASNNSNSGGPKRAVKSSTRQGVAVPPPRVPLKPNKPVPAPRKPSVKKQSTLVTDL